MPVVAAQPLLTTKLYVPPCRSRLVSRPRLLALLNEGLTRPLTLISAPAGFGKTTLLSEWRASPAGRNYPLAWVSLDQEDNDLSRFLLYLVSALCTLKPGVGESARTALQSQQSPAVKAILTSLVNDLNAFPTPFVLVLDDYHLITARPVHAALQFLLEAMPSQMHLVLLTRADPSLPLARLRARDQLTEIRLPGLRFQPEEAAEFLNGIMGLDLSTPDIAALESRTEGWIAGLQLAAVSLRQQADRHAFVAAFAGDDRYVMDYLFEEVLQRQTPQVQSFLLKTSILERLNASLCEAVTGLPESQAILMDLEQSNLFVTSLDAQRYWYRYHPLFADLLRHHLRQSLPPEESLKLVQRACEWYESNGLVLEAVSQALAAPAYDRAAALMERHVLTVFYRGETMLVHHWLQALPEKVLRQCPLLCAVYANTIGHTGLYQHPSLIQSEAWLRAAEAVIENAHDPVLTRGFIGLTRAYLALWKGNPPQAVIRLAKKGLTELPPETTPNIDLNFLRFRSGLTNNLGLSLLSLGDEAGANQAFVEAQRIGKACGDLLNMYSAISNQVHIHRRHGRLQEAADLCRRALDDRASREKQSEKSIPYIGVVYVAYGRILLEWNELEAAGPALLSGLELSRLTAASDGEVESRLSLAWLKKARGDMVGALALVDQASLDSPRARLVFPATQARLNLVQSINDPASLQKALRWAEGKRLAITDPFWQFIEPLTLARVRIAEYRAAAQSASALPLPDLEPLMQFLQEQILRAEAQDWIEVAIELRILQALALQAQGRLPEALEPLRRALELAEPGGYIRLFMNEGLPMRRLLVKIKANPGRIGGYVDKLLNSSGWGGEAAPPGVSQDALVEPLSARELEVLQLLAEGASNADIAHKLFISLNTTKKHLTHIFEKLAVPDRLSAIHRARELGLVQIH